MSVCSQDLSSDCPMVAGIISGKQAEFDRLYEKYFSKVYGYALKRLRDEGEAEDMTQEVFMSVLKSLPSYRGEAPLLHWIYGITRNKINYRARRKLPLRQADITLEDVSLESPEVQADRATEARRLLDRCDEVSRENLTELDRQILALRHLERQSIRAIACTLGRSEDAIKTKLYRIRQVLNARVMGLDSVLGGE